MSWEGAGAPIRNDRRDAPNLRFWSEDETLVEAGSSKGRHPVSDLH